MRLTKKSFLLLVSIISIVVLALTAACGSEQPATEGTGSAAGPGQASAAAVGEATAVENTAEETSIPVKFAEQQLTPETIRVRQGDDVTLQLETDRPGSFHIHGYDYEKEARVGEVTDFRFTADATGRFRINFHGAASAMPMEGGEDDSTSDSGGHHQAGHAPVASSVALAVDFAAEVTEAGSVHVNITTEGWHWAPEEVNEANADGAGHAHIYANGVKLSRIYGPYYYLDGLEPGTHELRVALNTNSHEELTWQGHPLESTSVITIPESASGQQGETPMEPLEAESLMSVEIVVHKDDLWGYNLETSVQGFEFAHGANLGHEAGRGYGLLSINGEEANRIYVPWLNLPAQGEGNHTFTVTLLNNEGRPYHHDGAPVSASVQVHEMAKPEEGTSSSAPGHDSGPDAAGGSGHHGNGSAGGSSHGQADSGSGEGNTIELEVGYLEVLPR